MEALLQDAHAGALKPVYNYLNDLPTLQGAVAPFLPPERLQRYSPPIGSFDAGRGCPFQCSFCTIINVQGRKSRHRTAASPGWRARPRSTWRCCRSGPCWRWHISSSPNEYATT